MNHTDFKNQVDALMNLLFGAGVANHSTIIEQINYLVFLRSLTKKDDAAMKLDENADTLFKGALSKYRWDNLLMLNAEALFTALEEVYKRLPELAQDKTIQLLFRDAHVKVYDKPSIRRLVHEIEKMMADLDKEAAHGHKDVFGDMYEYLLGKLAQAGTLGSFRTPRHIIKFIVDVIDPAKGETILDPACGTAGFLVAALEHLKHKYTSAEYQKQGTFPMDKLAPNERKFIYQHALTGYDSDFDMFKFGLMNLYLHQLEHPQIKRMNTLVDTAGDRTKWDVILANPPFAGAIEKESVQEDIQMGTRATEILFLRFMIDHLSPRGRAGVIVPEGVIFSGSNAHKKIRQMLVEESGLWAVVSLPAGVFNPYAGVKTSIVFFDKTLKDKNKNILFIKVRNDGFDPGATKRPIDENDIPQALKIIQAHQKKVPPKKDNELALLISKENISRNGDYILSMDRYRETVISLNHKWPMVELADVLDYEQPTKYIVDSVEYDDKYSTPVLTAGKSFILGHTNEKEGVFREKLPVIIFDDFTTATKYVDFPFKVKSSAMKILHSKKSKADAKYLFYAMQNISFVSNEHKRYWISQYSKIKIPLPPLEVQRQIVTELDEYKMIIDSARRIVDNWKPIIDIREEWEKAKIGDVCKIERGASPRPIEKYMTDDPNGYNWIKIGDAGTSDKYITHTKDKVTKEGAEKSRKVSIGDFILSNSMSFGRPYVMKIEGYIHDGWLRLIEDSSRVSKDYLYYILSSNTVISQFENAATGGVVRNLNSDLVRNVEIPLPPLETQGQIVLKIEEEQHIVDANKKLIEIYEKKIRDKVAEVWGSD
jgi:type I restriction enzyme M protein